MAIARSWAGVSTSGFTGGVKISFRPSDGLTADGTLAAAMWKGGYDTGAHARGLSFLVIRLPLSKEWDNGRPITHLARHRRHRR
jgi:hypothetical protein